MKFFYYRMLLGALCAAAPVSRAALPAAVTNQPLLFVVRNQYHADHHNTHTMFPSAPNEFSNGYYEGGNSALKVFDPASGAVRTILDAGAAGVIRDPDVHFSGTRIVFAWRKSLADAYHIYEINVDGTGLKQLTALPDVDDFDPVYLPDDRIVFVSGREPKYVMCNIHLSHNLYRMDSDGANITQIGKSTLFEGHPSLTSDGRLLYDRWEYVDRNFGDAQALWTSDPEGTGHAIYFGNNTSSPGGMLEGREIPGTQQAVCTFVACHDRPWGAIAVIDRRLARDGASAVVKTWPAGLVSWVQVNNFVDWSVFDRFGSTSPKHEDPYPLADPETGVGGRYFLCSRNTGSGEHMALYLLDAADNSATLLHDEGSGDVGCFDPMPLAARPRPGVVTVPRKYDDTLGRFYVTDVYKGTHMAGVARGTVKYLRVVESPEKRYYSNQGWSGQGAEVPGVNWDSFETKRILGTVPVEADGSAHFLVPSRTFVFFQLLDADGRMVQSMRSGTVIQPGEAQGCVGCHDDRKLAPHPTGVRMPAAFLREPDTLNGWQGSARLFNYLAEVQPVFNAKCVSCHDYGGTGAAKVVLAGDKGVCFNASYAELWRKGYTGAVGAGPAAIQQAKAWGSHASKLVQTILGTHTNRVTLTAAEFDRIVTWADLNAIYYPSYASNYPDNAGGRSPLTFTQLSQIASYTGKNVSNADSVKSLGEQISFDRPEKSPCLSGITGAGYANALALIQAGQAALAAKPREDMTNSTLQCAMDIWREDKYQQRLFREAVNRFAVTKGGKSYDTNALPAALPAAPAGFGASPTAASVRLSWTASSGAAVYTVKRSTTNGSGYVTVGTAAGTSFTDLAVATGTSYYYVVTAVNILGESVASSEIVAIPVNHAPVATAQSVTAGPSGARAVTLQGSDADGDPLIYAVVAGPAHGTLGGTPPDVTYTPAAAYLGGDLFTFKVSDGTMDSASATVTVTVAATLLAEDFEHEWADNARADTTNGWTSVGTGDLSSVTNPPAGFGGTEGGGPFPIHYDHASNRRVLKMDTQNAVLTAPMKDAEFVGSDVFVDMMVCFTVGDTLPTTQAENTNVKAALYLKADGTATNLYVFHGQRSGDGFGEPVFSVATNACAVVPGMWYRLTIVMGSATGASGNAEAFRVLLDGKELVSPSAYNDGWQTRVFSDPNTPDSGPWFLSAARRTGSVGDAPSSVTGLGLQGEGFIDDLVETYTEPNFTRGTVLMLVLMD